MISIVENRNQCFCGFGHFLCFRVWGLGRVWSVVVDEFDRFVRIEGFFFEEKIFDNWYLVVFLKRGSVVIDSFLFSCRERERVPDN